MFSLQCSLCLLSHVARSRLYAAVGVPVFRLFPLGISLQTAVDVGFQVQHEFHCLFQDGSRYDAGIGVS